MVLKLQPSLPSLPSLPAGTSEACYVNNEGQLVTAFNNPAFSQPPRAVFAHDLNLQYGQHNRYVQIHYTKAQQFDMKRLQQELEQAVQQVIGPIMSAQPVPVTVDFMIRINATLP